MKLFAFLVTAANSQEDTTGLLQGARLQKHNQPDVSGFIPRGRGGVNTCKDEDGKMLDGVIEDCTNQDFFVWKGGVWETYTNPTYVEPTYPPNVYGEDTYWATIPVNTTAGWETSCVAYVRTGGKTCKEWCGDHDLLCIKGMDDAHWQTKKLSNWLDGIGLGPTDCTLSPVSSTLTEKIWTKEPIDQSENGCNAAYNSQICSCSAKRKPDTGEFCDWKVKQSGSNLPPMATQDCTHRDFHVFRGDERQAITPTYSPEVYGSDTHWTTVNIDERNPDYADACVAYVDYGLLNTTCTSWCTSINMTCVGGMDDAHWQRDALEDWQEDYGFTATNCTLFPAGHTRQTISDNGCNQDWNTQICACV